MQTLINHVTIHHIERTNKKWLIIAAIMLVAILEVMDSTIVNVTLPTMMPALSANQEEITWILTSYVVASAMMLPLTGFLSHRIGQKKLLMINITGFMLSSLICGLCQSLTMMVLFRVLQGGFGAALIPLSQSILRQSFPLEEQGKAMAIWGLGIMVAPMLGPTLGGYITEYSSWRWVFYINLPICLLGLLFAMFIIPDSDRQSQKIDWFGILLMFFGIGSLQIFLDQGNNKDWFSSNFILSLTIISVVSLILFIMRSLFHHYPIIKFSIYKNKNFSLSCILLALFCGCVFGLITLQPIMLETLFHYDTITTGITLAPLGISSACAMIITSQLMTRINVKYLLTISLFLCSFGSYYLSCFNLNVSQENFIIANSLLGFGMGFFMVPLSTYSLATVEQDDITEASGLFSYSRMLGSSIGISLLSTLVTRETQINWNQLGSHITIMNNNFRLWLMQTHMHLENSATLPILGKQLLQQASMLAFIDAYIAISITLFILIPLVFLMKSVKLKEAT